MVPIFRAIWRWREPVTFSESASARTNLAVNLVQLRKESLAEAEFKKAVELEPQSFDANHNLGEFYVHSAKLATAVPYLEKAQSLDPTSYANGYDLALALVETGELDRARRLLRDMTQRQDSAELRNLLAETVEKRGDYMAAVTEYECAAHMEPSEKNIFDWEVSCCSTRPWSRRWLSSAVVRSSTRNPSACRSAWALRFTPSGSTTTP